MLNLQEGKLQIAINKSIIIYKKERYAPHYQIKENKIINSINELKNGNVLRCTEHDFILIYKTENRKNEIIGKILINEEINN